MRISKLFLIGSGALAVTALAWAQQQLKPGSYEITIEMALPGSPTPVALTDTQCLSADETRDLRTILQQELATDGDCKFSEVVTKGDTVSWDTTCKDLTAKTEITVRSDGFNGTTTTTIEGTSVVAKFASKWIGNCTAGSE